MADEIPSGGTPAPGGEPQLPLETVTAAAPAPIPAPDAPPAPPEKATEAAPEPKIELTTDKPSLLETHIAEEAAKEAKPEESGEKPAESAKTEEKPKEAAKPEEKAPEKPAEEPKPVEAAPKFEFKLPEALKDVKTDDPTFIAFNDVLGNDKLSPQERGEKLLELHQKAIEGYETKALENQHKAFNDVRQAWQKEVLSDPEIGGAGHRTSMQAIARARDLLISSHRPGTKEYQADAKAFDQFLRITGAGDHPVFLKLLHHAARYFDEPAVPSQTPEPTRDNGKAPRQGARVLYDNPRSNPSRAS